MKCCRIALYLTDKLARSKGTVFSGMSRKVIFVFFKKMALIAKAQIF